MTTTITPSSKVLRTPKETFQRVAFYGPMGVGKSWCAQELVWHNYHKYALAGKLKAIAYDLYGIAGKDNASRKVLQELGMDLRKHDSDVWIKYLLRSIADKHPKDKIVVDDLRFVNEARLFRENGFILVLVTCDEDVRQARLNDLYPDTDPARQKHASEQEWTEIEPDFVINSSNEGAAVEIERMLDDVAYRPRWSK